MRNLPPEVLKAIQEKEEDILHGSCDTASKLWRLQKKQHQRENKPGKPDSKEGQLRNILEIAQDATSFLHVEVFILYQAARKQIPREFVDSLLTTLKDLESLAREIAQATREDPKTIHLELVTRFLGYLIRWYKYETSEGEL